MTDPHIRRPRARLLVAGLLAGLGAVGVAKGRALLTGAVGQPFG
jgi:hypothetical protein